MLTGCIQVYCAYQNSADMEKLEKRLILYDSNDTTDTQLNLSLRTVA